MQLGTVVNPNRIEVVVQYLIVVRPSATDKLTIHNALQLLKENLP